MEDVAAAFCGRPLVLFAWCAAAAAGHRLPRATGATVGNTVPAVLLVNNGSGLSASRVYWPNPERVHVCWETAGHYADKLLVRRAVASAWQRHSRLRFRGWAMCNEDDDETADIRVAIDDVPAHTVGIGSQLRGRRRGMVLNFAMRQWRPDCPPMHGRRGCLRELSVHEFGHAIGLTHEHNRAEASAAGCGQMEQGTTGDRLITTYDPDSVMNYCRPARLKNGTLSQLDVLSVGRLYGRGAAECPASAAFSCHDLGACVPVGRICDGRKDCADGSDEANCNECEGFACAVYADCIPAKWQCNGYTDCVDGSDERHCDNCGGFTCADGQCILPGKQCDGQPHCTDGSDEAGCPDACAGFVCADRSRCIPADWLCDTANDCNDGSDEANCTDTAYTSAGSRAMCYTVYTNKVTQAQATAACAEDSGAVLANAVDRTEYEHLLRLQAVAPNQWYWVNGNDGRVVGERNWQLEDGTPFPQIMNDSWAPNEPNNFIPPEHCVSLFEGDKLLNDLPCSLQLNYFCMRPCA